MVATNPDKIWAESNLQRCAMCSSLMLKLLFIGENPTELKQGAVHCVWFWRSLLFTRYVHIWCFKARGLLFRIFRCHVQYWNVWGQLFENVRTKRYSSLIRTLQWPKIHNPCMRVSWTELENITVRIWGICNCNPHYLELYRWSWSCLQKIFCWSTGIFPGHSHLFKKLHVDFEHGR